MTVVPLVLSPRSVPQFGCAWSGPAGFPEAFAFTEPPVGVFLQHFDELKPTAYDRIKGHTDKEWVEVMRVAAFHIDEVESSWYWEAKGSGIWLNLGRTLVVNSRRSLTTLGINVSLWWGKGTAAALISRLRQEKFDTIQFSLGSQGWMRNVRYEIVDMRTPGIQPGRFSTRPFISKSCTCNTEYRSGWDASLPCDCQANNSLLNCNGRVPPGSRQGQRWISITAMNDVTPDVMSHYWKKITLRSMGASTWEYIVSALHKLHGCTT